MNQYRSNKGIVKQLLNSKYKWLKVNLHLYKKTATGGYRVLDKIEA